MNFTVKEPRQGDANGIYQEITNDLNRLLVGLPIEKALDVMASYIAASVAIKFNDKKQARDFIDVFAEGVRRITDICIDRNRGVQ